MYMTKGELMEDIVFKFQNVFSCNKLYNCMNIKGLYFKEMKEINVKKFSYLKNLVFLAHDFGYNAMILINDILKWS